VPEQEAPCYWRYGASNVALILAARWQSNTGLEW
jgi:hypothetical protein